MKKTLPPDLTVDDPHNWNLDKVEDSELVVCCYWEYARESTYVRDTLQHWRDWRKAGGKIEDTPEGRAWNARLERIQSIGYPADVYVRGLGLERGQQQKRHDANVITGSFPDPWQSLSKAERKARTRIRRTGVGSFHLAPVQMAHWPVAKEIVRWCESVAKRQSEQWDAWAREHLRCDAKGHYYALPGAPEPPQVEPIRPRALWGVPESLVVEIAWENFTNDQIATYFRKWVKHARPKTVPEPDGRGHKEISWRVAMEQLGIMRLLRRFTVTQLREKCPAAWKRHHTTNRRWQRDAEKARARFHNLFPFLPAKENPLTWPPKNSAQQPA
jgi:hypothetical protein